MSVNANRFSLYHRFCPAPRPDSNVAPLLILLHGYGSNEDDLIGLAPYLDPRLSLISVRAPHPLGPGSYAWFPITWNDDGVAADLRHAVREVERLFAFIGEAQTAYHADASQTMLLGFSQGATMAAGVLLRRPELVAGGALLSGFASADMAAPGVSLRDKPVLITHGALDPVVPVHMGRAMRDLFTALGAPVEYHEYPIGHQLSEESLADLDAWLSRQLR